VIQYYHTQCSHLSLISLLSIIHFISHHILARLEDFVKLDLYGLVSIGHQALQLYLLSELADGKIKDNLIIFCSKINGTVSVLIVGKLTINLV